MTNSSSVHLTEQPSAPCSFLYPPYSVSMGKTIVLREGHINYLHWPVVCFHVDLHSELSRQNRKANDDGVLEKQVAVEGGPVQNGANLAFSSSTSQHTNVVSSVESSYLIKANPSPQGTPLHTTFSGTQNFTPSTRISALNMVGDLLRKVGVSALLGIVQSPILWCCCCKPKALESRLASCRTHTSGKELPQRYSRTSSPGVDTPK